MHSGVEASLGLSQAGAEARRLENDAELARATASRLNTRVNELVAAEQVRVEGGVGRIISNFLPPVQRKSLRPISFFPVLIAMLSPGRPREGGAVGLPFGPGARHTPSGP